jgi:hypothetical protein
MENFKSIDDLLLMDEKHRFMGLLCGSIPSLEKMHAVLKNENLNIEAPEEIKSQFNVAKNMAMYSYFFYALAPEVHLKTYTLIEHALRLKSKSKGEVMLSGLLKLALKKGWIKDSGL